MDQNGHGTFVAGVVGAVGNNALVCLLASVHAQLKTVLMRLAGTALSVAILSHQVKVDAAVL